MKKGILIFIFVLTCNFNGSVFSEEISFFKNLKGISSSSYFPRPFDATGDINHEKEILYPVGFSEKGHFAFFYYNQNWGCGACPDFNIINLVTDEKVFTVGIDNDTARTPLDSIENLIKAEKQEIMKAINDYGIQPLKDGSLKRFPLELEGEKFDVIIEKNTVNDINRLILNSSIRGQKQVTSIKRKYEDDTEFEIVEGYLKSPFENRIVIFVSDKSYGLENEWAWKIYAYGAHLKVGFK